jgi:hypothetical protein
MAKNYQLYMLIFEFGSYRGTSIRLYKLILTQLIELDELNLLILTRKFCVELVLNL